MNNHLLVQTFQTLLHQKYELNDPGHVWVQWFESLTLYFAKKINPARQTRHL